MCSGQNGHRHLGALYILYHQQPTALDRRFIEIRQWPTAEGEYSDLIVEQGLLKEDDLQTETMVMPFHCTAEQALDSLYGNGRKGEESTRMKKVDCTACHCANPCLRQAYSGRAGLEFRDLARLGTLRM